jgi:hypothetical protein
MTKQEIFDKVATHLITQNKKSYLPGGNVCAYRGENGCKCAIGILIPDDKYDPFLEGKMVGNKRVLDSLEAGINIESVEMLQFLNILQNVHDNYTVQDWKGKLIDTAKDHDLSFEVLLDRK